MPLWAAGLLCLLFVAGAVLSLRAYSLSGGKKFFFLAAGIANSLLCTVSILYIGAVLLFVSSVK